MSDADFIVWSSEADDPARAELAQARAAIAANAELEIVRESGDADAPRRLLIAGDEEVLRQAVAPFAAVRIESNRTLQHLRDEDA